MLITSLFIMTKSINSLTRSQALVKLDKLNNPNIGTGYLSVKIKMIFNQNFFFVFFHVFQNFIFHYDIYYYCCKNKNKTMWGIGVLTPAVKNPCVTFDSPKT